MKVLMRLFLRKKIQQINDFSFEFSLLLPLFSIFFFFLFCLLLLLRSLFPLLILTHLRESSCPLNNVLDLDVQAKSKKTILFVPNTFKVYFNSNVKVKICTSLGHWED